MPWVGDELKQFANTPIGKIALVALASADYAAIAPFVGPQLAAITFATPGLAAGDDFAQAWTKGFIDRAQQLASDLGGQAAKSLTDQAQAYVTSALQPMWDGLEVTLQSDLVARINAGGLDWLKSEAQRWNVTDEAVAWGTDAVTHGATSLEAQFSFDGSTGAVIVPPTPVAPVPRQTATITRSKSGAALVSRFASAGPAIATQTAAQASAALVSDISRAQALLAAANSMARVTPQQTAEQAAAAVGSDVSRAQALLAVANAPPASAVRSAPAPIPPTTATSVKTVAVVGGAALAVGAGVAWWLGWFE